MPKFQHASLLEFCERLLRAGGFPERDSTLVGKLLVNADRRGYPGHGIIRIPSYSSWIQDGTIDLATKPKVIREGKTTAALDANHYVGQVVAYDGMKLAIDKAKEHGVGIVSLARAGHVGRLADYMEMAADAGMIGIAAVCVGAGSVTLYGGMQRITGTNPMAFGIPARNGNHIILDFATAAMSMGELQKRDARGEPIPENVMLDGYGNPAKDMKTFRGPPRGVLLPFGGYKGSGLNLVVEILGGILSGNGLGKRWWDKGAHAVNGVFLHAIAVEEFQPLEEFFDQVDELISHAKALKPARGFNEVVLPGEHARKIEARQMKDGVEIDDATWEQLRKFAAEVGITDFPNSV
ncbi:MAG TPA: Ldh family oxidoreductase [Candidatus Binatia bacterium]